MTHKHTHRPGMTAVLALLLLGASLAIVFLFSQKMNRRSLPAQVFSCDAGEECTTPATCQTIGGSCNPGGLCANNGCCCILPRCGDGIVQTGEQCDDGNTASGDGCSATCQVECPTGTFCTQTSQCASGNGTCGGTCGTGFCCCNTGAGACPDGTCNASETCTSCPQDCGACAPVCGNGTADPGEQCGEPGLICHSGELCSNCQCQPGTCDPTVCTGTFCGSCDSVTCTRNCDSISCQGNVCRGAGGVQACSPSECIPGDCPANTFCTQSAQCASGGGTCGGTCSAGCCCSIDAGTCPDGTCNASETCSTCPQDCGVCASVCGDGTVDPGEQCDGTGQAQCAVGQTCTNCQCIQGGSCQSNADCNDGNACTTDVCANGTCTHTPLNCDDGNACTTDGCSSGSCTHVSIPNCAACGNGTCDNGEVCSTCPDDCGACPAICGDGVVTPPEQCDGAGQAQCAVGQTCTNCQCSGGGGACGDGICNGNETCSTCSQDCGVCPPSCGDGQCNGSETCSTCSVDCGTCPPTCGNGACDAGETCQICPADCGSCPPNCGDGTCSNGETCSSCSQDCGACPAICGDGVVTPPEQCENTSQCPTGQTCANCQCTQSGSCQSNADCNDGNACTTDSCTGGICAHVSIPNCGVCSDGQCNGNETCSTCSQDCGVCPPSCGDGQCNGNETCSTCSVDCGTCPPTCGNGACDGGETCQICPADCGSCPPNCGDGTCSNGETCSSCSQDCGTCGGPLCGNAVEDFSAGEECDDGGVCTGGAVNGSACATSSEAAECVRRGGTCQPQSGDGCSSQCVLEALCGNGILEFREQCDDGGVCIGGTNIGAVCTTLTVRQDCGLSGVCAPRDDDGCDAKCAIEECKTIGNPGNSNAYIQTIYNLAKFQPGMDNPNYQSPADPRGFVWFQDQFRTRYSLYPSKGPGNEIREIPFIGPIDTIPHDPSYFASKWEGIITVPRLGNYTFFYGSRDDAWVIIDGTVIVSYRGIHGTVVPQQGSIILAPGTHRAELYYVSRTDYQCVLDEEILCNDGIDNDGDTLTDCADPDCANDPACLVSFTPGLPPALAITGVDGNGGLADFFQHLFSAASRFTAQVLPPPAQCYDGLDNDGDGAVDCADFGCRGASEICDPQDTSESGPQSECEDGIDNDGDGKIDFGGANPDPECSDRQDNSEADGHVGICPVKPPAPGPRPQCFDGVDNDGDGAIDYPNDLSCSARTDADETNPKPACFDGIDNDGDGLIDFPADPGCAHRQDNDEFHTTQCADGIDNDGDGAIDLADFSCGGDANSPSEFEPEPQCADGIDNDGDGAIDLVGGDVSCSSNQDNDETDPPAQCGDGIDNDGDGAIDFPEDVSCTSANDTDEGAPISQCQDELDNDGDGAVDCQDFACLRFDGSCDPQRNDESALKAQCQDGIDNDGRNGTDFPVDPGCSSLQDTIEFSHPQCQDGVDNDGDGGLDFTGLDLNGDGDFIDPGEKFPDAACASSTGDNEAGFLTECQDGVDNADAEDTLADSADPGCHFDRIALNAASYNSQKLREDDNTECSDGFDNDLDTFVDSADSNCHTDGNAGNPASYDQNDDSERPACSDGFDNDGDGLKDLADPNCANANDESEIGQCQDGLDNDGDGATDFPADFSCGSPSDDNETDPRAQCQDLFDNDTDFATDYPADFACDSLQDNNENDRTAQCQDNLDNDSDTWKDAFRRVTSAISLVSPDTSFVDSDAGRLYVTGVGGRIVRFDIPGLTNPSSVILGASPQSSVFDPAQGRAFLGSSFGTITRFNVTTMSVNGSLTVPGISTTFRAAVIDRKNRFAYFASQDSPGELAKINIDTFTLVGTLPLTGVNGINAGVIDVERGYAYFGTDTAPGKVVKINLKTFALESTLDLASGENVLASAAIDTTRGFAYFGTITSPGKLVKVNLNAFQRVGSLTLLSGENTVRSVLLDPVDGSVYAGADGIIVKASPNLQRIHYQGGFSDAAAIDSERGNIYFADASSRRVTEYALGDPGCGSLQDNSEAPVTFPCNDGIDNDADGFIDGADISCHTGPGGAYNPFDRSEAFPESACHDFFDNDSDGASDFPKDFSCSDTQDDNEASPVAQCQDGSDNDADTLVDFIGTPPSFSNKDPGCFSNQDNDEANPPQCNDGSDNDNDGATDFPADKSCDSPTDNNETAPIKKCQDALDNDGDGGFDYPEDYSCTSQQDDAMDPATFVFESFPKSQCQDGIDNDADGATDYPADFACGCSQDNREGDALAACQDLRDNDGDTRIDTLDPGCHTDDDAANAATYDNNDNDEATVPRCGNGLIDQTNEQCDNGGNNSNTAPNACRTNCLNAHCGDAVIDTGEQCDDGNTANGDGCSASCQTTVQCSDTVDNADPEDTLVDSADPGCHSDGDATNGATYDPTDNDERHTPGCGNGSIETGEQCDSGAANSNTAPNACRTDCRLPRCGDGAIDTGEQCDDGNTANGDGCSSICVSTTTCNDTVDNDGDTFTDCSDPGCHTDRNATNPASCDPNDPDEAHAVRCGNGAREAGEQCDDGNTANGDGCSDQCQSTSICADTIDNDADTFIDCADPGCHSDGNAGNAASCTPNRNSETHAPACGNGVIDQTTEQCDDGNTVNGDGCSVSCQTTTQCNDTVDNSDPEDTLADSADPGCHTDGNTANSASYDPNDTDENHSPACGNGAVDQASEQCDDGNVVNGDGCSDQCRLEENCVNGIDDDGDGLTDCSDSECTNHPACDLSCHANDIPSDFYFFFEDPSLTVSPPSVCPVCGDGFVTGNEVCDMNGNIGCAQGSICSTTCDRCIVLPCGNGRQDPLENCNNCPQDILCGTGTQCCSTGQCQAVCSTCGNGTIEPREHCDASAPPSDRGPIPGASGTWTCDAQSCELRSTCGNGIEELGEQCEVGAPFCTFACEIDACSILREGGSTPGFLGFTYNLPSWRYGMDRSDITGPADPRPDPFLWFSPLYLKEVRKEPPELSFPYPMNGPDDGLPGDRAHHSARWIGTVTAPVDGIYAYTRGSRDESWVIVDAVVADATLGLQSTVGVRHGSVFLTEGTHVVELYFVSRQGTVGNEGIFSFRFDNPALPIAPYLPGCPSCGNGIREAGETCDDGFQNGAGQNFCNTSCTGRGSAICGNGSLETGETCDDGNTVAGDGCSDSCQREPACGNGFTEGTEECDDGNLLAGDGCSDTCTLENICGNGTREPGEQCDDGNRVSNDGCSSNCQLELVSCGNAILEPGLGEQCDFGGRCIGGTSDNVLCTTMAEALQCALDGGTCRAQDDDNDGCNAQCRLPQVCGDGRREDPEECDFGTLNSDTDPDLCRRNCRLPRCGDTVRDSGEQCDTGDARSDLLPDRCRLNCELSRCGDAVADMGEECDQGVLNHDTIPDRCRIDCTLPLCGDGVTDPEHGETCDDGNVVSNDGCSASCALEPPVCGNGRREVNEECDDGNVASGDNCSSTCTVEVSQTCGDGTIQTESGEQCDDGNTSNNDLCDNQCQFTICGDGNVQNPDGEETAEQCDDANAVNTDACTNACRSAACGDGLLFAGVEECDDGNTSNGDTCSAICKKTKCGDGTRQQPNGFGQMEECDDGNTVSSDACTTLCKNAVCGDGFLSPAIEQCDDGNRISGDGCATNCITEQTTAVPECGNGIREGTEQCDDGNTRNADGCSSRCISETACGNGIRELPEECDDGNLREGDGCSRSCILELFCGNGKIERGEACDDGNIAAGDGCGATCKRESIVAGCGNGRVEAGEECDAGAGNSDRAGDACRTTCKRARCGDGTMDTGEQCDEGAFNANTSEACRTSCTLPRCGDGILDYRLNERCDDGNTIAGDGCSALCQQEVAIVTPSRPPPPQTARAVPPPSPPGEAPPSHEAAPSEGGFLVTPLPPAYDVFDEGEQPTHAIIASLLSPPEPTHSAPKTTPATGPSLAIVLSLGAAGAYALRRLRKRA